MRTALILSCFFSALSTLTACKTIGEPITESSLQEAAKDSKANVAVILVHGWGKTPRKPNGVWRRRIRPYTDLSYLRSSMQRAGFSNVNLVEYDDTQNVAGMAKSVAAQIQSVVAKAKNPDLQLDVIGHSLGQYVALKTILEHPVVPGQQEKISERVRIFIGLAGVARGQDQIRPCNVFKRQCGGLGALRPYYRGPGKGAVEIDKLFATYRDAIDRLRKCSLHARADEVVDSPYDAGSFSGLGFAAARVKDVEVAYGGSQFHKDVKDSQRIIDTMLASCYAMLE